MRSALYFICIAVTAITVSCSSPTKQEAKTTITLDTLLHDYHEERLKLYPLDATFAGDDRFNDLFPNSISESFRTQARTFFTKYKQQLASYERSALSEADQMNYDVLQWECDIALEGLQFKDYLMPVNQMFSVHLLMGQMASGSSIQPFKTVKDYDNWLSRANGYVEWVDTAIVNMRKGIAEGYVLNKALIRKTIPQFAAFDHGPVKDHLYYAPIKNIPAEFSEEDKQRLTKAFEDLVQNEIIPSHRRMKEFLQTEYLAAGADRSGIDRIPDGKAYYDYTIRYFTTTSKSALEIFELGKQEVDRITKEMENVKQQVGYTGDLKSFFNHLRARKELMPFKAPEEVITHFNEIHERMKPNLTKLFDRTPKSPFEVRRTEAFREASASAEYIPGSKDGSRPGVFYVPIPDAKQYNVLSDEDLFLHEAIPGHHYQVMLQMENDSLPAFRQILLYSAYAEGWALYTESLGKELGLYTDPYQYFGMLSAEMHRAIRLVVDAGMHTQGWTREQAIQYSKEHEAETEESIVSEIERYMAGPGQALSYKIGQLKIMELRRKSEKELGDKFNIAQFHNQILESGCIPLKVMEDKIDRWIAAQKQAK